MEMILEPRGLLANEALPDSSMRVVFAADCPPGKFLFLVRVTSADELPYFTVYSDPFEVSRPGRVKVEALISRLMLMPGEYKVWLIACSERGEEEQLANDVLPFKITSAKGTNASFNLMWNEATWRVSKPQ